MKSPVELNSLLFEILNILILNFNNYYFEFIPTETSVSDTLLYIANHLS